MSRHMVAVLICVVGLIVSLGAHDGGEISPSGRGVTGSSLLRVSIKYMPLTMTQGPPSRWHTIEGHVIYGNGLPARGFRVTRHPDGTWVETDARGHYAIYDVRFGSYAVSPTSPDHTYQPDWRNVSVPPDAQDVDFYARADGRVLMEVGSEGVSCYQGNCWADVDRVVNWVDPRLEGCAPMGIGDPDPYSIMWSDGQSNVNVDETTQPGDIIEVYGSCVYDVGLHLMMFVPTSRPYFADYGPSDAG